MTAPETSNGSAAVPEHIVFPDPPEDHDDKAASFDHLSYTGAVHFLAVYLGEPETTLVGGELYLAPQSTRSLARLRYPDVMVAFGVDPEAYRAANAYVISEQGKPPDLVLEVASRSTAHVDVTEKRDDYAALGVPEYWRFDATGEHHGARLGGDRLVDGSYFPVELQELAGGVLQGYSPVLDLFVRWEAGALS